MNQIRRAVAVVSAVIVACWRRLRAVFASRSAQAVAASRAQLTGIRRRYALGAASREQLDTAMRKSAPATRRVRKGGRKASARKAA